MKNYFKSLFAECPRYRMVIWWVFRALMIYAFIKGFFPGEGRVSISRILFRSAQISFVCSSGRCL